MAAIFNRLAHIDLTQRHMADLISERDEVGEKWLFAVRLYTRRVKVYVQVSVFFFPQGISIQSKVSQASPIITREKDKKEKVSQR